MVQTVNFLLGKTTNERFAKTSPKDKEDDKASVASSATVVERPDHYSLSNCAQMCFNSDPVEPEKRRDSIADFGISVKSVTDTIITTLEKEGLDDIREETLKQRLIN